jgi:lysyl-tRNA synthetase class I
MLREAGAVTRRAKGMYQQNQRNIKPTSKMSKTTIIQYDSAGRVVFKAETPGHQTRKEIRKECKKWKADYSKCIIKYS